MCQSGSPSLLLKRLVYLSLTQAVAYIIAINLQIKKLLKTDPKKERGAQCAPLSFLGKSRPLHIFWVRTYNVSEH